MILCRSPSSQDERRWWLLKCMFSSTVIERADSKWCAKSTVCVNNVFLYSFAFPSYSLYCSHEPWHYCKYKTLFSLKEFPIRNTKTARWLQEHRWCLRFSPREQKVTGPSPTTTELSLLGISANNSTLNDSKTSLQIEASETSILDVYPRYIYVVSFFSHIKLCSLYLILKLDHHNNNFWPHVPKLSHTSAHESRYRIIVGKLERKKNKDRI